MSAENLTGAPGFVGVHELLEGEAFPYYVHCDVYTLDDAGNPSALLTGGKFNRTEPSASALSGAQAYYSRAEGLADYPFTFQQFSHTSEAVSIGDTVVITLFDVTFGQVEYTLAKTSDSKLGFQYYRVGPEGGRKISASPLYGFIIYTWRPEFTLAGIGITVEGLAFLVAPGQSSIVHGFDDLLPAPDQNKAQELLSKGKDLLSTYLPGVVSPDGLRISEIVERICSGKDQLNPDGSESALFKAMGKPWKTTVNGKSTIKLTRPVKELSGGQGKAEDARELMTLMLNKRQGRDAEQNRRLAQSSGPVRQKSFIQNGQSDLDFIRDLVKYSVSEEGGLSDYVVHLTGSGNPTDPLVLHFHPRSDPDGVDANVDLVSEGGEMRTFTYLLGLPQSEVIRFTPSYEIALQGAGPGAETTTSYTDAVRAQFGMVRASAQVQGRAVNEQLEPTAVNMWRSPVGSAKMAAFNLMRAYQTALQAEHVAFNVWYSNYIQGCTAELETLGDPTLVGGRQIQIVVVKPDGMPHISSGVYYVARATHSGGGGVYTTVQELIRTGPLSSMIDGEDSMLVSPLTAQSRAARMPIRQADGIERVPHAAGQGAPPAGSAAGKGPAPVCGQLGDRFDPPGVHSRGDADHPRSHLGVDIVAPAGTTVSSPVTGIVTETYFGSRSGKSSANGNTVVVHDPATGRDYYFLHLQQLEPGLVGQEVSVGDYVGQVGSTGHSTGPHLHFQVWDPDSGWIDPLSVTSPPQGC